MTKFTPIQTLTKVHRELWWTIRLVGSLTMEFDRDFPSWGDSVAVEEVLRSTVKQVETMIRREREKEQNQRNNRPGGDLALKAQVAKAREPIIAVVKDGVLTHSHK